MRLNQGNLAGALQAYRASLALRERLAATDPSNAVLQGDLSVSHYKRGETLRKAYDPAARDHWRRACDILSAMRERGLHVSPNDLQFLAQLRAAIE